MSTTTTAARARKAPAETGRRAALFSIPIALSLLLALQLLLALALALGGRGMAPAESQGSLIAFDPETVTAIRIQTPDGEPVLVTRTENGWTIPSLQDLPAAEHRVTGLLSKLAGLQKGLPVATSEEALTRFKVADQDFERRLTLESGEAAPVTLYLGDSPGFRRLFVRAEDDGAVYEAELGLFDVPDKADAWSDRTLLHLKMEDIQKLAIAGVTLERKDDSWQLSDLAEGEKQDEQAIEDLVGQLANLDFLGVLAGDEKPQVDTEATPVEIEVTLKSGETLNYRIAKLAEGNDYLLEISNRPQRFTLTSYVAKDLTDTSRANLLEEREETTESFSDEPPPADTPANEGAVPAAETAASTPAEAQEEAEASAQGAKATGPETATPAPGTSQASDAEQEP